MNKKPSYVVFCKPLPRFSCPSKSNFSLVFLQVCLVCFSQYAICSDLYVLSEFIPNPKKAYKLKALK